MMRHTYQTAARISLFTLLVGVLAPGVLHAQDPGLMKSGSVYAIQNKAYRLKHEVHASLGVLPMDAFYKGATLGVGYTRHFSHHLGWEVIQCLYSLNMDTGLKGDLEDLFSVERGAFREVNLMANTNVVFVPLYGKMSYRNRKVVRMEAYLSGGPGVARYTTFERSGASGYKEKPKYHLSMNWGVGLRLFASQRFSVRLDLRDYMNFVGDGMDHAAYFGLGLSWNILGARSDGGAS